MTMKIKNFAVLILTHGRPDHVVTYRTLRKQGYTGDIYIVIDNEDDTADRYRDKFGDQVIVFDKEHIASTHDEAGRFQDRRSVFYARNASFQIARDLGLKYFLQLDDDYRSFRYMFTGGMQAWSTQKRIKNLDRTFDIILEFYAGVPAATVAMAQSGDLIGGIRGSNLDRLWLKRKAMNTFFCSTARPFQFVGRINEDVNTYVLLGNRGELFFTFFSIAMFQERTQQSGGGMTELYLNTGTYVKSFYTVMYAPSCVKVGEMGVSHRRIHHVIDWPTAVPCILREEYRKSGSLATERNGDG